MIRVDIRPRHRNSGKGEAAKRCQPHLQWLRGRPCALAGTAGHVCSGPIIAAHVDFLGNKGMSTKTEDWHAIPLCDGSHQEQHRIGWGTFQRRHQFDAAGAAERYAKLSPHRARWEGR